MIACSVCFGASDAPMAVGTNMGIFLMLGVTGVVLAGFAGFFIYLMRRARLFEVEQARAAETLTNRSAEAGLYVPTEGTAQC